jgi:hypothetical protein
MSSVLHEVKKKCNGSISEAATRSSEILNKLLEV